MSFRGLQSGIIASFICLTIIPKRSAPIRSAPTTGTPAPHPAGGIVLDSRKHPHQLSRDSAFSMTTNKYGIKATLQTSALQIHAEMDKLYRNSLCFHLDVLT